MNYSFLVKHLNKLDKKFNINTIGQSVFGRKIFAVERFLNKDFFTAVFVASIHARENITTDLVLKFLEDDLFAPISDFNIAVVPMLNPDGVELCFNGINGIFNETMKQQLIKFNDNSLNFSLWKANARGVDINNNFDAGFGKFMSKQTPSSQGFAGKFAESECETLAIENYIKSLNPFFVLAYHSKGEEIYYNYFQHEKDLKRDKTIAERFSNSTGYKIVNVENLSSGGLKDWTIEKLKIPALTIEIGSDDLKHPIKRTNLEEIYQKHKTIANDLDFAYNVFMKYR